MEGITGMRRWMMLAMIVTLMIPVYNYPNVAANSISEVEQELRELGQKEGELQSEKQSIKENQQEVEGKMDENLGEQASLQQQLDEIEAELAQTQAEISAKEVEIDTTNKEINELEAEIEQLMEEIDVLQEKIEKREEILKDRLRSIQESGGNGQYLSVILGSQSFSELISRSTAVNSIMDQDKNIMEEQFADQQASEAKQVEVEA